MSNVLLYSKPYHLPKHSQNKQKLRKMIKLPKICKYSKLPKKWLPQIPRYAKKVTKISQKCFWKSQTYQNVSEKLPKYEQKYTESLAKSYRKMNRNLPKH